VVTLAVIAFAKVPDALAVAIETFVVGLGATTGKLDA